MRQLNHPMRPLYDPLASKKLKLETGNAGLWYDKYCHLWEKKETSGHKLSYLTLGENKEKWIHTVCGLVGNREDLQEACERQHFLAKTMGSEEPQFFKTQWRFISGMGRDHPVENGFAWHQTLGVPYLPGSSVKGLVRSWVEEWEENIDPTADIERIFGPQGAGKVGSVVFFDAIPADQVKLEPDIMTPHYPKYYGEGEIPGDWQDPIPIPFLAVSANQVFQFSIVPRTPEDLADANLAKGWLALALLWLGAGAKTAVGYGRMEKDLASTESFKNQQNNIQAEEALRQIIQNMDPLEKEMIKLCARHGKQMSDNVLIKLLEEGKIPQEDQCRVAKTIKKLMEKDNSWRLQPLAKNPKKDKKYNKTMKVLEFLQGEGNVE